jgi:hypothetical protein
MLAFMLAIERPGVLLGLVQDGLGPGFGGKVAMAEVTFEPPDTVEAREVALFLPPVMDKPLFQAPSITFAPNFLDLIAGQPGLGELRIPQFELQVVRRPDGSFNLPGGEQLAALLPEPGRSRVLTALSESDVSLAIDSILVEAGRVAFQDELARGDFSIEEVAGRGRLDSGILRIGSVAGKAFKLSPVALSGRVRWKPPSSAELQLSVKNLPAMRLVPWLLPPRYREQKEVLVGDLSGDASFVSLGGISKVSGHLVSPALGFDDGAVTRTRWQAHELVGDFRAARDAKGQPECLLQFQGRSLGVSRGSTQTGLRLEGVKGELELQAGSLMLRLTEGHLGQGSLTAGGVLDPQNWNLVVQAQNLDLGVVLAEAGLSELAQQIDSPLVESAEARISAEGLEVSSCKLRTARDVSFEGSCFVQSSPDGPRLARANGVVAGTAGVLADLTGFASSEGLDGPLSIEVTADTTQFTALVRAPELSLGLQPRLLIKGLAAAISGVEAELGGQTVSGWSANVRTSRFTIVWDALLQSLGFPENWPLAMNSGSATVVRDLQGLHVTELRCQGIRGEGSGEVHLGPQGQLSGRLQMQMSIKGSLETTALTRILSGTLEEPVVKAE